ncbi:MAG TPA: LPS assembly protein LptD [Nevskiaceae bacterium]|nr:LPS assembly protein LptD [Nevskiaceae bacterium]
MTRSLLIAALMGALASLAQAAEREPVEASVCPQPPLAEGLGAATFDQNLSLTADKFVGQFGGVSDLFGDVRLTQGDAEFVAHAVQYNDQTRKVSINAESLFRNHFFVIRSAHAEYDLNGDTGLFLDTQFLLSQRAAHGQAGQMTLTRTGVADLEDVRYTTCAPEHEAWQIRADKIHLDQQKGTGSARGASLRLGHVPIFYAPWFEFPIDDRRHSGLLFPVVGNSNNTGFDFRWPIYLNLAPNYDAEIIPREMTKRGPQIGADFRYLLEQSKGHAHYEYLDRDQVLDERRTYVEVDDVGRLTRHLGFDLQYAEVSDPGYFEDFGGRLDTTSISYLDRYARMIYQAPASWSAQALVEDFQAVSRSVLPTDKPYKRLPELRLDALTRNNWRGFRVGFDGEYVNFMRKDALEGQRLELQPFVRFLVDHDAWYVTSQADWQYTRYQITSGGTPGSDASPERQLPIYSAEGGLRFERLTGAGNLQTLEPQLLYLYVPYRNQDQLPVFDSGEPDFDFVQLFARNRFSGEDRISDANHLAAAFTTRLLDPTTGLIRFVGSIGEIYRMEAPRVTLPNTQTPDVGVTDFIAAADVVLNRQWSASGTTQWSPDTNKFVRTGAALHYHGERTSYDLSYRFRRGVLQQVDNALRLPLFDGLSFAGRYRYSVRDRRTLESLAGLEYESCCWAVQASVRRFISNSNGDYSNGVYVQLQLKGLTRIGSSYDAFMPEAR